MRRYLLALLVAVPIHAQWTIQQSNTTADLRGIHALGNGVAWASGSKGTVLRTIDNGTTWQTCAVPPSAEALDFRGIQAFDAQTAIVMSSGKGDLSRLYKTTDACKTWKLVFTNPDAEGFWDAIQFSAKEHSDADRSFGVLLGDPVAGRFVMMLSYDFGDHWIPQVQRIAADPHGEAIFAASNSSLFVTGRTLRSFVTGGKGGPRLVDFQVVPDDTQQSDPIHVLKGATPLHWLTKQFSTSHLPVQTSNESSGGFSVGGHAGPQVIVGGDYTKPEVATQTAWYLAQSKRTSGWTASSHPPHGYRSAVAYDSPTKMWITVGPNGTDVSTDDGRNWHALRPGPNDAADADQHWNALSLPFVVGPHGRIGLLESKAPGH